MPGEIRVALIVRMGRGLLPVSGTTFEKDDQVHVLVHAVGRGQVPEDDGVEVMRVVVAGAGTLGRRVTRYVSKEHTVTLIEQDPERCTAMAEEFGELGRGHGAPG